MKFLGFDDSYAHSYRLASVGGILFIVPILILCVYVMNNSNWGLSKYNRTAPLDSQPRTIIEALIATRDGALDPAMWQERLCAPSACADFPTWRTQHIDPLADVAAACLIDGSKIGIKQAPTSNDPIIPDVSTRSTWLMACLEVDVSLRIELVNTAESTDEVWRIASMQLLSQ